MTPGYACVDLPLRMLIPCLVSLLMLVVLDVFFAHTFIGRAILAGTGFEPSVPRQEKWSMPSSSDQTRVGRTLTLEGGAESSLQ